MKALAIKALVSIVIVTSGSVLFAETPSEQIPAVQPTEGPPQASNRDRSFKPAMGELQVDLGYERRENDSGGGASAATSRQLRISAQQHYFFSLSTDEKRPFHALSVGLGARSDRGHWSPDNHEQIDLSAIIGWRYQSWFITFGYIFFAHEKSITSGVETQNQSGSGLTVNARYFFWWDNIGFGPVLTFDSIHYKRTQAGSLPELTATQVRESLRPGFTLAFQF